MFERYDPSKKAVKTIGFDGEIYDSGLEARFANTLTMQNVNYTHNGIAIFCEILGGQYKPDFVWDRADGKKIVAEVKGWQQTRAIAAADALRDYCDDETSPIAEFIYAWSNGITLYKDKQEARAAFYVCRDCGETSVEWAHDPFCPHCGSHDQDFLCVDFNNWANEQWEKKWSKTWQRYINKTAYEKSVKDYVKRFASRHETLDLVEGKLCLLSEHIHPGQWKPDFYYTEQPLNRKQFGTALAPIAVILVSECPTNAEKHAYQECLRHVSDPLSPIVKLVFMDHDGVRVADYYTQGNLQEGHWYKCSHCGKVYAASDEHPQCPCCDCHSTTLISGKE